MKPKFYPGPGLMMLLVLQLGILANCFSQTCGGFTATYSTTESRCTATGSLQINATGGSGTYNYEVQGPTNTSFTSTSLIGGLQSGSYTVTVKDIVSNCTYTINNVTVSGSYSEPRFGLTETDVTCNNGSDGVVSVTGLINGRSPFSYMLVAPSTMGVGTTNSTGTFTGLAPGSYSVQLTDSCGGLQTRNISVQNYNWSISSTSVTLSNCTNYNAQIALIDNKGNTNTSGSSFNGFQYGVVNSPGDTSWFSTYTFAFNLAQNRTVALVAKDRCGLVQTAKWSNTSVPSVQATVTLSSLACSGFTASVTGQQNLTNPQYCLVDGSGNSVSGQPCNTTGSFTSIPYGSYSIKVTNTCYDTVITRSFTGTQAVPAITGAVSLSNYSCTGVQATVTGQQNLTNPQYCLFTSAGTLVGSCNTTGIFTGVAYGSYTIKVTDGCTGTILPINFTATQKVASVSATVTTNGVSCSAFAAAITGATNLTNPQYCLVDNTGNPVPGQPCNSTGSFTNITYGAYCIDVTDACNDTTIQRCINMTRANPTTGTATISNKTCSGFSVTVSGQANVYSGGLYCLTDASGNPVPGVPCSTTNIFTNVPYGSYCIKTTDYCSGNILTTCFTATPPVPAVGTVTISSATCARFTATQTGQQNLMSPTYCLYDALNNQVGACNKTGIFTNIGQYGSYSIKTTDSCTGTVLTTPFSATKPIASVNAAVGISNQTCSSFTASMSGQTNLTGGTYYLKDNAGNAITNNHTGVFSNIPYGSYCLDIVSGCMDTTMERCFTASAIPTQISLTAKPSCTYNSTDVTVQVISGVSPYTVQVYDTLNNLITTTTSSSSSIVITALPSLITAQRYKITVTSSCGAPATAFVSAAPSSLSHVYTITPECPSSVSLNGSDNLLVIATTNLSGTVLLSITQKNFSPVSIGYSNSSGSTYTFSNLDAATYVITYSFSACSATINDTVVLPAYAFPDLANSAAYQCNNNSFSVGAALTGGISPYTYQVIGSTPSSPVINTTAQSNPVFTINNGVQYSLIRLRAIDACGNAALNDVNILPLANTIVTSTSDCLYQGATLSVPVLPNASYTWYQKTKASSTDSVIVGTGATYTIPYLTVADTGIYVNRMSVNSGCLTKLSYFDLDGMCGGFILLPVDITLKGNTSMGGVNQLNWMAPEGAPFSEFIVERSDQSGGSFVAIGTVMAGSSSLADSYTFADNSALDGANYYRLAIQHTNNAVTYSNIVALKANKSWQVSVYPNPVTSVLNITIRSDRSQDYAICLYNVAGQILFTGIQSNIQNGTVLYRRDASAVTGWYFLRVSNLSTGESSAYKVKFE